MKKAMVGLCGVVTAVWFFWSVTLSGLTVFSYLAAEPDGWNAQLSYALSAIGLVPVIGGIIAAFMSDTVHGWGFFHAAANFLGYLVPAFIAAYLSKETAA